jgi:two-component system, OmpR family, sensor kinase
VTLRARLTLLYGGLLLVVLVAIGFGAQLLLEGRFTDQTHSSLSTIATYVKNNYQLYDTHGQLLPKLPRCGQKSSEKCPLKPFTGYYLEIIQNGKVVETSFSTTGSGTIPLVRQALMNAGQNGRESFSAVALGGEHLAVYYYPLFAYTGPDNTSGTVLVVAKSQNDTLDALKLFQIALFGGGVLILILGLVVTWLVVGSALRPIKGMTEQAASIAATRDFSGRVPVDTRAAELQRLAVTFNQMLASLEEAYANQQRFLADASHELRTPLTVVLGNLEYLDEARDAPQADRFAALEAARMEAERMSGLVSDLLALSQADAGYTIQHQPVEIDAIVVDAYGRIKSRERTRRTESGVQIKIGRLEEAVVNGDSDKLLQLVMILLDNGVKYTPPGGQVTVDLVRTSPSEVRITVADTGIGIPPGDRAHIFDRFYRSRSARSMNEGSGLGLPIAKWIAEAHGGTISVEDGPEGGTVFIVTLPSATPLARRSKSNAGAVQGKPVPQV